MNAILSVREDILLKAMKKVVWIPGHQKKDGTTVRGYQKTVLVATDHDRAKVAAGHGSHYQKEAHKKLSKEVHGWDTMSDHDKTNLVLAHATDAQEAASLSADISKWKKAILSGKPPSQAQQAAMVKLMKTDAAKTAKIIAEVEAKVGGHDMLMAILKDKPRAVAVVSPGQKSEDAKQEPVAEKPAPLHVFENAENGVEAHVVAGANGKFHVALKDQDSGEFVQSVNIFDDEAAAIADAKKAAGVKAPPVADHPAQEPVQGVSVDDTGGIDLSAASFKKDMAFTLTKVGKKWAYGKAPGKHYEQKILLNSATSGWAPGKTVNFSGFTHYVYSKYGTSSTVVPATLEMLRHQVIAAKEGEIKKWLGWVIEHAGEGYIYNKGVDKLKELGISHFPELQAKLQTAIQPLLDKHDALKKEADSAPEIAGGSYGTHKVYPSGDKYHVQFPYSPSDVAEIKKIPGAKWDATMKKWNVPKYSGAALKAILDKHAEDAKKADEAKKNAIDAGSGGKPAQDGNSLYLSGGSGYGYSGWHVGQVVKHDKSPNGWMLVTSVKKKYFKDEGMSFGVGDDSGYVYQAYGRPATDEEAAPAIALEVEQEKKKAKAKAFSLVQKVVQDIGYRPGGSNAWPAGEKVHDSFNLYGGGSAWVVGDDAIWFIQNNGSDGANWSVNNIQTGGAGAIGWMIPFDQNLADFLTGKTDSPPPTDLSPKDGDTKTGAYGTLVFRDGRWHKEQIDPATVPGTVGWHVSLDAGKVPTPEQHEAITNEGFDKHLAAAVAKHGKEKIHPLVAQAATNWVMANKPDVASDHAEAERANQKVADALAGKHSHYKNLAAHKLSGDGDWQKLPPGEQWAQIKAMAQEMQAKATTSAYVSGWKKAAHAGKNPTLAQWKAFYGLPNDKKSKLLDEVTAKVGGWDHLKAPPNLVGASVPSVGADESSVADQPTVSPDKAPEVKQWSAIMHNTQPGHSKFYAIEVNGSEMTKKWGKIGTVGQSLTVNYMSHEAAIQAASAILAEKAAHGYVHPGAQSGQGGSVSPATDTVQQKPAKKPTKAEAMAAAKAKVAAIPLPTLDPSDDLPGYWPKYYQPILAKIQEVAQFGGLPAVKKLVTFHSDGSVATKPAGLSSFGVPGFKTGKCHVSSKNKRKDAFATYCKAIEAVFEEAKAAASSQGPQEGDTKQGVGGTLVLKNGHWELADGQPVQKKPAAKPAATMHIPKSKHGDHVTVMDAWKQTGPQEGSNTGGRFQDKSGQEWYCKFPSDPGVVRNEFLAAKFYQMLGVAVPSLKLVEKDGKLGIASKWVDGLKNGMANDLSFAPGTADGFVVDAWLANWDVVGLSNDNLKIGKDGQAVRVDAGGALLYRAQGGEKGTDFGDDVPELDTLKDHSKNAKAAAVFAGIPPEKMAFGLSQLNKLKPSQIAELCQKIGPGSDADKAALAAKLTARRAYILKKFGVADQWDKPPVDETKIKVDPTSIKQPIDFVNFNGQGKGLSSKAHVNERNTKDSQALFDFAVKGNLAALKDYHYDAVDKETGAPLGKKPISEHPSAKIQEQWASLIQGLQSIAYPPVETLEFPSLGSFGSLAALSEDVGSFDPEENVTTVATEHRMGYFMKLAHLDPDEAKAMLSEVKWVWQKTGSAFGQKLKAGYHAASPLTKQYIHGVQASGSVNHIWSQGKSEQYGVPINKLTASIYADAVEVPEGTQMWRWMDDDTAGKSMTKMFLASQPGAVIQNTDSMCTSFHEHWGDHPHFVSPADKAVKMRIRCAPGVKVTPSWGSGGFGSEGELTTLPGQRFLVVDIQKGGHDHPNGAFIDVIALPPDPGFVAKLGGTALNKSFTRGQKWAQKKIVIVSRLAPSQTRPAPLILVTQR